MNTRQLLQALPAPKLDLLKKLAVPRFLTPELRGVLEISTEVEDLPFMNRAAWDLSGETYVLEDDVRAALLETWIEDVASSRIPQQLSELNGRIAKYLRERGSGRDALYHQLATNDQRTSALAEICSRFDQLLGNTAPKVGEANDLLRLLDEWPLWEDTALVEMRKQLRSKLARRSLWSREREATIYHLARSFEVDAWEALHDGPQWMLQIYAPGGGGKTMCVRNLLGRVCPAKEIATARVDFDYVAQLVTASNQPWRLLLLIARQLSRQLPGEPFASLLASWSQYATTSLPKPSAFGAREQPDSDDTRGDVDVPAHFRAILAEQNTRVVVVFDTLENILHTDGATLNGIVEEMIAVHQQCPLFRVVLSGRFELSERCAERVAGFRDKLVGPVEHERVEGPLRFGKHVITLALPPFSTEDRTRYLTEKRGIASTDERVGIAAEKSDGNPLKLAMLADALTGNNPPSADELRRLKRTELIYLADRVLDRIGDPRVQWLLRWGVIPRVLSREFASQVIWPRLQEQWETLVWDRPDADELAKTGRGVARYDLGDWPRDFDSTWQHLTSYAAGSSWVMPVADLADTVAFHPETRDPLRGELRICQQKIYYELNRAALGYWQEVAKKTDGLVREDALRSVLFHAFEPLDHDNEHGPTTTWHSLIEAAGDDTSLRAALAREALDIENRVRRKDREDLPPVPVLVLAQAHGELARDALARIHAGGHTLAEFRSHLAMSHFSEGMREALHARALIEMGNHDTAVPLLVSARKSRLDEETQEWVHRELSRLTGDIESLTHLAEQETLQPTRTTDRRALADEWFRRDGLVEALQIYRSIGCWAGAARCLIGLGEYHEVLAEGARKPLSNERGLLAEAYLATLDPKPALDLVREDLELIPLAARAHAMLGDDAMALSVLDSLLHSRARAAIDTWIAAARVCLDLDRWELATRFLTEAGDDLRAALMYCETSLRSGEIDAANRRFDELDFSRAPRALQASALVTQFQLRGLDDAGARQMLQLMQHAASPRHALAMFCDLHRVLRPPAIADKICSEIAAITRTDQPSAACLTLARIDLLRVLDLANEANDLVRALEESSSEVTRRYAKLAADRLRTNQNLESFHKRANDGHVSDLDDVHSRLWLSEFWSQRSRRGGDPVPRSVPSNFVAVWREECEWLGRILELRLHDSSDALVIGTGLPEDAWIPWQLATLGGKSIVAASHVRSLRRANARTQKDRRYQLRDATIIYRGGAHHEEYARTRSAYVGRMFSDAKFERSVHWSEWRKLVKPGCLLYIIGHFEQRKGGSVAIELCNDSSGATSASQLARALLVNGLPAFVVLDVPWPGSESTAAIQLFLREVFAWELFKELSGEPRFSDAGILCLGFERETRPPPLQGLLQDRSLTSIVGELQEKRSPTTFAEHLTIPTLYANNPDAFDFSALIRPMTLLR